MPRSSRTGRRLIGLASLVALIVAAVAPSLADARRLPPRNGGDVQIAWPRTDRGKPNRPLERYLAKRVGGRALPARSATPRAAAAASSSTSGQVNLTGGNATAPTLRLVRSFDIPAADPSYARLLNLSFTYDSALAATAFVASGDRVQAEQLLDQLMALQRADGSIDYAFDTYTGASDTHFWTGTIAWVGLAAETYRSAYKSARYSKLSDGVKTWLLSQQLPNGLMRGGPTVTWASTLHNLIAWFFLTSYADNNNGKVRTEAQAAADRIAAGIDSLLLATDATGLHFLEGQGDPTIALDAQTLGILYLLQRGRAQDAGRVADWMQANLAVTGRSISLSSDPATFNQTYSSPGPFSGYRPYGGPGAPDVLWMEGTLEARLALASLGRNTTELDSSIQRWRALAGSAVGPLMADRTVTNSLNEYHVWPVSATASWTLLESNGFTP